MLENLIAIATLTLLEGILSVDNALAMALQVRALEPSRQRRALLYGVWGALILRTVSILSARWLMHLWWLQLAGALYLAYLAIAHFVTRRAPHEHAPRETSGRGFWATVAMVELTDAAFAIDSTLVAIAMSDRLWVILSGVVLGIVAVRYAAVVLVKLLQRCPEIEHLAFILVGWVAIRLFTEGFEKMSARMLKRPLFSHLMPDWLFWTVVAIVVAIGAGMFLRAQLLEENRITRAGQNLIRWCQHVVRRLPLPPAARRVVVTIIGTVLLLIGVAMIFLPGPAVLVIPAALAILATEFAWARTLLARGRNSLRGILRT